MYMAVCGRYIMAYDSFPAAPARLARLKAANLPLPLVHTRHTQVQAQLCLLFASFASFAPPPRPAWQGLAWQWRQWAGPLPARHCTRRIFRPAAIHVVTPTIFTSYPEKGPELSELYDSMRHFVKRNMNLQINEPPNPLPGSRS